MSFFRFVEDMEASAIEHELERSACRWLCQEVRSGEAALERASGHFCVGLFDSERRDVESEHIKAAFGHPDGIGTGSAADFERKARRDCARSDEVDEQRFGQARVPGQLSGGVAVIPRGMRHQDSSLALLGGMPMPDRKSCK